jgi:hypothetical protein
MTTTPVTLGAGYFDGMYQAAADPWRFEDRWYERRKYAISLALLPAEWYRAAFEPGCSIGVLGFLMGAVDAQAGPVVLAHAVDDGWITEGGPRVGVVALSHLGRWRGPVPTAGIGADERLGPGHCRFRLPMLRDPPRDGCPSSSASRTYVAGSRSTARTPAKLRASKAAKATAS